MSKSILIRGAKIVNEGIISRTDIRISGELISAIGDLTPLEGEEVVNAEGRYLLPGVIDGQVHFRDPGLTHKADLESESIAAVAGGTTSFIEMPNTKPNVLSLDLLEEKYRIAEKKSVANYGFLPGVNSENMDQAIQWDTSNLLAITDDGLYFTQKGNILADNPEMLEKLFANTDAIVAIHSEKEEIIEQNEAIYREKYGEEVPFHCHPLIRSEKACYEATERAIALANKHNARLHILHLSTAAETSLFRNDIPLKEKNITTEVSVHHLWFCDKDYERLGPRIKWNPAIKTEKDREGLLEALLDDRIDFITTDHAPHAIEEKEQTYFKSMSGAPMVQHALNCMLEFYRDGKISLEKIVEKMAHKPAEFYSIDRRGFIREGYYADLVLVDMDAEWTVSSENILYKCGWSPLEGTTFHSRVTDTFVNGHHVYSDGKIDKSVKGKRLVKA